MNATTPVPTFKKGDKVYFGRVHGEKTLGEITKVNPKKYKIKQLEDRGAIRDYKIGTIWTVPFNLVTAAPGTMASTTPVSAPVTRTVATCSVRRGERAEFTKGRKVVTGTVKSVNDKTVTLVDCDDNSLGYRVPFRMIRPATQGKTPVKDVAPTFPVGTPVTYRLGGRTLNGIVIEAGMGNTLFEVANLGGLFSSAVRIGDITRAPKRTEATILADIRTMYSALSPENLTCDGELSNAQVRSRSSNYNRILRALFVEIGRKVSESEAYKQVSA